MVGIIQASLNKQLALDIGLAQTTFIGMSISFILGLGFYIFVKENPQAFPSFFEVKRPITYFKWWYIFPGMMGFFIILSLPGPIKEIGAVKVTILIIAGQIIASSFWDYFVENLTLNAFKALGIFFAILSVVFTMI